MGKLKRTYSQKTLKILYALSGHQCAFPDCGVPITEPGTPESGPLVVGEICHIYAVSEQGPRGKSGLQEKELNAPENLIILCPNHHRLVDGQPETYTADLLKSWKQAHEALVARKSPALESQSVRTEILPHHSFPLELVDQKINEEVQLLRQSRFFADFDSVQYALSLVRKLLEAELSGGTERIKSEALAWCARLLSTKYPDKAEELLTAAKSLGAVPGIRIAEAFVAWQRGSASAALDTLATVDSPAARTASYMIVAQHKGLTEALEWLRTVSMDAASLDADGKFMLLAHQLHLGRWNDAAETTELITENDCREAPVLQHMMAKSYLVSTVPEEFRHALFNHVPLLDAASFPLHSDASAVDIRRKARRHFTDAEKAARRLNCQAQAAIDNEYGLWLELRDPEHRKNGRQRLMAKLSDLGSALRLVPLGLQFGIKLDLTAVEQEIDRHIALHGGTTQDAEIARFVLFCSRKPPREAADYIVQNEEMLTKYLTRTTVRYFQIEILSQAGLPDKANEYLDLLLREGIPPEAESRLRTVIAEAKGTDAVEARRTQFEKTGHPADLKVLVDELEARQDWDALSKYGTTLFEQTRSAHDAEKLAAALYKTHRTDRLVEFLAANAHLFAYSGNIRMFYCWALYEEGHLLKARSELGKLNDNDQDENYRALRVNLASGLGDWSSLDAFAVDELQRATDRTAHDLLEAAHRCLSLGSPHARRLVLAAVAKGYDDAGILTAAYDLAARAGWEGDPEAIGWLHRAVELSGDQGPAQRITVREILGLKPGWDRHEDKIWQALSRGEVPMIHAAQLLNRSLVHFMLFPAYANLSQRDPRRRGPIPAYSGNHKSTLAPLDTGRTVGMDATMLLTLSFLYLLETALDTFHTVYIPHSTLHWLSQEKQRATFHQPSRIREARVLRDLLATDVVEKWNFRTTVNDDLAVLVGDDLALLIVETKNAEDDPDARRIVVQPTPVYRPSSLMKEETDLTEYASFMCGCSAVVDKLRLMGQITAEQHDRARAYLQFHEKPWPQQAEISEGATLYLSSLAVSYFMHLGLLEALQPAGFRVIVSPRSVSEADDLIAYEGIADKVNEGIEHVRLIASSRIESGKIRVGRMRHGEGSARPIASEILTRDLFSLTEHCDAIVADDRALNRHGHIEEDGCQTPIFSTMDVLDALVSTGAITPGERLEYRTRLRRAGYLFVPVEEEELAHHLLGSAVRDNKVVETAELKAIRENILLARMTGWLQLPEESDWLFTTIRMLIRVLKTLWTASGDELPDIEARSNWIAKQLDLCGWAQSFGEEYGDNLVKGARGELLLLLINVPSDTPQNLKDAYLGWVEDNFLAPFKEQYPDLYARIVEREKSLISNIAATDYMEEQRNGK